MSDVYQELKKEVQAGGEEKVKELITKALDGGVAPVEIIEKGLRPAMEEVGKKFETLEIFLPEMIMAADTMAAGVELLRPHMSAEDTSLNIGKIVLGTVQGDVHRIGKDIVRIMLEGSGFKVYDVGHDVADERFIEKIKEVNPNVLAMSALMTTTMQNIPRVIEGLQSENIRDKVKIVVGGAPVLPEWAEEVGADGYGKTAVDAVNICKKLSG